MVGIELPREMRHNGEENNRQQLPTLPAGVRNNRYAPRNEIPKGQQRRLDGPPHRAHDDEAHVQVARYPGHEGGPQLGALPPP